MPLRLTYVVPFGPPATQFGGPVAQLDLVGRELAARGHTLRIICADLGIDPDTPRDTWLERRGYHIRYGRTRPWHRAAPYYTPLLRDALEEAIATSDIVHLHLGLTLLNALARRIARAHRVPYVYAPRGALSAHRLRDRRLSKAGFLRLFEHRIIRDAAGLHALTREECDDLAAQGGDRGRMHVIPNAVDMGEPADWPNVEAARGRFDVPADAVVLLFLGQLHPVKGLDLLIDAVAAQRAAHPALTLLIAGPDAGAEAAARRQVSDLGLESAVRFVGHLDARAKLGALRAADIFALPSYAEGLPNAVLEACHLGLPVLVSEGCRLPEIAEHDAGFVVPPQRDRVSAALGELLASAPRRAEMGRNARALAEQRFAVPRVAEALETMYARVLGREAHAPRSDDAPSEPRR